MHPRSVPIVLIALALGLVTLRPSPAVAQEERRSYLVVKGGPYFPTETNAITAAGNVSVEWPTKYAFDLGLGADWGIFGVQLSGGYFTTGTTVNTSVGSGKLDVRAFPFLLIARVRLPLGTLAPYLQGGAGVAVSVASFDKVFAGAVPGTQVDFEVVGGAGLDVYLGSLVLGAEGKYLWLNPSFTVTGATNVADFTQRLNMSGIAFEVYVGYRWS
jgi:hypothetical protein